MVEKQLFTLIVRFEGKVVRTYRGINRYREQKIRAQMGQNVTATFETLAYFERGL